MLEGIPRISVLIICYKQENLIGRALDSLLSQKDYIYEICVSDDCSPDNTWQVLQNYKHQYPDLIKLHQNEPNVGIFENIEQSWTMPTGDIIYQLSGDDEAGEGWFKKVVDFICSEKIDYKNELFCIYGDFKCIYPNGDSCTILNKRINSGDDALKLATKGRIFNRSCCFSSLILKKYVSVSQGRSYMVEEAQDRQLQLFSKKNYYIPHVGNIYYSRVGVSSNMSSTILNERSNVYSFFYNFLNHNGFKVSRKEECYFKYKDSFAKHNYFVAFWFWLKSLDFSFDDALVFYRRVLFAVKRRLPHKQSISNFKI